MDISIIDMIQFILIGIIGIGVMIKPKITIGAIVDEINGLQLKK